MSIGDVVVRTCKGCGVEFNHTVKSRGRRPDYCESHGKDRERAATDRYRKSDKYRKALKRRQDLAREVYDPWQWENTILEWDE